MKSVLNKILAQDEKVFRATSSYVDDIIVDEDVLAVEKVQLLILLTLDSFVSQLKDLLMVRGFLVSMFEGMVMSLLGNERMICLVCLKL